MLELLDDLLGLLAPLDIITPLARMLRGPRFEFRVPHRAGWGIYSVGRILKRAGCRPYGLQIIDDVMILAVSPDEAQRGYWALHKAGVPMLNDVPGRGRRR